MFKLPKQSSCLHSLFVHPCYCSSSCVLLGKRYSSSLRLPFVSAFVPLVVSNFFPYFSVCIYCSSSIWARLDAQFSLFSICLLACLPCSLQVLSLVSCPIIDILLSGCLGKNGFPGLWCFALLFFFVQVSLLVSQLLCLSLNALGRNLFGLLYVTLPSVSTTCYPTCLSTWFPCPLSTTVLLSRSPALAGIRPERKGFLLIPFFITYLFL